MKYKNRRLTVGVSRTINTGSYESIKIHSGISVDVQDRAEANEAYLELFDEMTKQIVQYETHILGGDNK